MKKTIPFALAIAILPFLSACGSQETDATKATPPTTESEAEIEADTSVTLDPDTSMYHDMAQ